MPTAALRSQTLSSTSIDGTTGVLLGVKVAELNHVASFKAGEATKRITITQNHIDALLSHAGNRAIPVHWTHDYLGENKDRLHAKVGALKNLRRDDSGNLVADLHIAPTEYRERILWNATNDPEGMMMSAVFMYGAHDPDCIPLSFDAADLVAEGAGVKALFTKTQTQDDEMKPEDFQKGLLAALATPEVATALAALSKPAKTEDETNAAVLAAENEAGVEDVDRKPEDAKLPAALASAARINRATLRKMEAVKVEAKTLAKAEFMAAIGSPDFALNTGKAQADNFEAAVKAEMTADSKINRGMAILRASRKNPELYNAALSAGKN